MDDDKRQERRKMLAAELLSRSVDDDTLRAMVRLAQKGLVVYGFDFTADEFTFSLSEQAVKMYEEEGHDSVEDFIRATEPSGEIDLGQLADQLRPAMITVV